ncbi:MAG TPA: hypothetical protein VK997_07585 [Deferrisomatales bacterium]|nr:hypothetical protein [Deferrisomatales bacterium]
MRGSRNDRDTWPCRRVPEFARAWTGVCSGTHTLDVDVSVDARTVSARLVGGHVFETNERGAAFCREHRLLVFSVNVWHRRADGGDSMGAVQERGGRGVIQLPQDGVALRRPLPGDPRTEGIEQRASDHEVGHALGQEHPLCETNQLECYGVPGDQSQPLAPEAETLMGIGRRVSTRDYAPFATMMAAVVSDYRWSVVAERPGTPGDVRAGAPCTSPFRRPSLYPTSVRQRA